MGNFQLIESIRTACDRFDRDEITLSDLQAAIEGSGQALEGVSRGVYTQLHDYCNALELIEFGRRTEQQQAEGRVVTTQVRDFLCGLEKLR